MQNSGCTVLDSIVVSSNPDCVLWIHQLSVLLIATYELVKSVPKCTLGEISFFSVESFGSNEEKTGVIEDCSYKLNNMRVYYENELQAENLKMEAGIFDIKIMSENSYDLLSVQESVCILVALSNGQMSILKLARKNDVNDIFVYLISQTKAHESSICGADFAFVGHQKANSNSSTNLSCLDKEDCNYLRNENLQSLAVIGTQRGSVHVYDTNSDFDRPIWSCTDAHSDVVWQVSWMHGNSKPLQPVFISGSDDASFKVWDIRTNPSDGPALSNTKYYQSGVTCFEFPRNLSHLQIQQQYRNQIFIGSYDCSVSLWDMRLLQLKPIWSQSTDSGVWRIKFFPFSDYPLLAIANMQDGFDVYSLNPNPSRVMHYQELSPLHIAYGIDWIPIVNPPLLATCSFYDNKTSLIKLIQ